MDLNTGSVFRGGGCWPEAATQREDDRRTTTRGEAASCCCESESIDMLSLDHPGTPVAWLPVVWCDCQHQDFITAV